MSFRNDSPGRVPIGGGAIRPKAGSGLEARIPSLIEAWRTERRQASIGALGKREIEEAGAALLSLQRGLTGSRSLAGTGYMDDGELLGAYLLYYWPVSYLQVSLSLAELPFAPRRVLDIGSGPGPASAAVLDAIVEGETTPPEELVLVDSSRAALDLATSILAKSPNRGGQARTRVSTAVLDLESDAALPEGSFDLVVIGHCLNELWRGRSEALDRRLALVERAAGRLAPGGRLLVLEPALLLTCRDLIALRDRLALSGWRVLGPCTGSFPCPAFAAGPERSCHAESPWAPPEPVASLAKAAGLDRASVKWAYFFLAPKGSTLPAAALRPEGCRRVVSDAMLNKAGRLRYLLCGDGRLETLSARADAEEARSSGFLELRRGDILRAEGLEERPGGGLGLVPESSLGLRSRAPEASAPGASA